MSTFLPPAFHAGPTRLVDGRGAIRTGHFLEPVRDFTGLKRPIEWFGVGLPHPRWYLAMIIVRTRGLGFSTFYGVDRHTGRSFSHDTLGIGSAVTIASSPWSGETRFASRKVRMTIRHALPKHHVDIAIDKGPRVRGSLVWHEDLTRSPALVALTPMGTNNFIYNHKAQMPIEGSVDIDGETVAFDPARDLANMDEVRGDLGLRNHYAWFNLGGFDAKGRIIGFNAADCRERADTENVIWAGSKLSRLGAVRFTFDPRDLNKAWTARDHDGRVDLRFIPEGGKSVRLGPIAHYDQKCGVFSGTLRDDDGEVHEVKNFVGCSESLSIL